MNSADDWSHVYLTGLQYPDGTEYVIIIQKPRKNEDGSFSCLLTLPGLMDARSIHQETSILAFHTAMKVALDLIYNPAEYFLSTGILSEDDYPDLTMTFQKIYK